MPPGRQMPGKEEIVNEVKVYLKDGNPMLISPCTPLHTSDAANAAGAAYDVAIFRNNGQGARGDTYRFAATEKETQELLRGAVPAQIDAGGKIVKA